MRRTARIVFYVLAGIGWVLIAYRAATCTAIGEW